jgi:predicted Zn-dependent protease
LIKFLDSEDELMGVLGHEIAHADCRHSTAQLTKQYGIAFLADALLGNKAALNQIAKTLVGGVAGLSFSRVNESEADSKSVQYLCSTSMNAAGAAGFFKKWKDKNNRRHGFLHTLIQPTGLPTSKRKHKSSTVQVVRPILPLIPR